MNKIHRLDDTTVSQIAAGEVIERPASVVKELVENAMDAEATRVLISVEESPRYKITVSDNGEGMTREDLLLCTERHTTSKIKKLNDLYEVSSYGFRGEALFLHMEIIYQIIREKVYTDPLRRSSFSLNRSTFF